MPRRARGFAFGGDDDLLVLVRDEDAVGVARVFDVVVMIRMAIENVVVVSRGLVFLFFFLRRRGSVGLGQEKGFGFDRLGLVFLFPGSLLDGDILFFLRDRFVGNGLVEDRFRGRLGVGFDGRRRVKDVRHGRLRLRDGLEKGLVGGTLALDGKLALVAPAASIDLGFGETMFHGVWAAPGLAAGLEPP